MNRKSLAIVFLTLVLVASFITGEVFADGHGKSKGDHGSLDKKLYMKAHFLLKNEKELGLTDAQVEQIKNLKYETKKDIIKRKAEIDVLAVDIKRALWADTIDTDAINALIDKKYELKKAKAKTLVSAYAKLKATLTDEQKEKMKTLWSECSKK